METYIVYVGGGDVLGGAQAETPEKAASAVVTSLDIETDAVAIECSVVRVTDPDVEIGDSINPFAEHFEKVLNNEAVMLSGGE